MSDDDARRDRDEPVKIDAPFEDAVKRLLAVDPDAEPTEGDDESPDELADDDAEQ